MNGNFVRVMNWVLVGLSALAIFGNVLLSLDKGGPVITQHSVGEWIGYLIAVGTAPLTLFAVYRPGAVYVFRFAVGFNMILATVYALSGLFLLVASKMVLGAMIMWFFAIPAGLNLWYLNKLRTVPAAA